MLALFKPLIAELTIANVWLAVGTIVLSGVFAAYVTQRLITSREYSSVRRDKLEKLYFAVRELVAHHINCATPWLAFAEDRMTFPDAQNHAIEAETQDDGYSNTLMLVELYFKNLDQDLERLMGTVQKLHDITAHMHRTLRAIEDYKPEAQEIRNQIASLELAEADFHRFLFREAAHLGRSRICRFLVERIKMRSVELV